MVTKHLSESEAQKKLEQVVKEYDWIGEFLGPNKDSFLRTYRAMYAQLKDDDRLEIEIKKQEKHTNYSDFAFPDFCIVHYKTNGTTKVVHTCDSLGNIWSNANLLLYDD
jgi:hypothetical protein